MTMVTKAEELAAIVACLERYPKGEGETFISGMQSCTTYDAVYWIDSHPEAVEFG